jgi:hypothetical protein
VDQITVNRISESDYSLKERLRHTCILVTIETL